MIFNVQKKNKTGTKNLTNQSQVAKKRNKVKFQIQAVMMHKIIKKLKMQAILKKLKKSSRKMIPTFN